MACSDNQIHKVVKKMMLMRLQRGMLIQLLVLMQMWGWWTMQLAMT
jgi:hypothetical protein